MSRQLPSSESVPLPVHWPPARIVTSREGLLPSTRSRESPWISNSPATVRLLPAAKFTSALVTESLPPTGTLTGTRTMLSAPQPEQFGSANTSHKPRFSTRPPPCRSNRLFRLIQLSVPRFASGRFKVRVVEVTISNLPARSSNGALRVRLAVVRSTALVPFSTIPAASTEVSRVTA